MWESITDTTLSCHFKVFHTSSHWNLPFSYLLSTWNLLLSWHGYLKISELWINFLCSFTSGAFTKGRELWEIAEASTDSEGRQTHLDGTWEGTQQTTENRGQDGHCHRGLLRKPEHRVSCWWFIQKTRFLETQVYVWQCHASILLTIHWWCPFYGSNVGPRSVFLGGAGSSGCSNWCLCMTSTYFVYPFHMKHVWDS